MSSNSTPSAALAAASRNIRILVNDKARNETRTFVCETHAVEEHMSFFVNVIASQRKKLENSVRTGSYIQPSDGSPSMAINVNCDVEIFEWLLAYVKAEANKDPANDISYAPQQSPQLVVGQVVSVILSSHFLGMERLCLEACQFLCVHLGEVLMSNVNVDCLPLDSIVDGIILKSVLKLEHLVDATLYVVAQCQGLSVANLLACTNGAYGIPPATGMTSPPSLPSKAACSNRKFLEYLVCRFTCLWIQSACCGSTSLHTSEQAPSLKSKHKVRECEVCGQVFISAKPTWTIDVDGPVLSTGTNVILRCPGVTDSVLGSRGELQESHTPVLGSCFCAANVRVLFNILDVASPGGSSTSAASPSSSLNVQFWNEALSRTSKALQRASQKSETRANILKGPEVTKNSTGGSNSASILLDLGYTETFFTAKEMLCWTIITTLIPVHPTLLTLERQERENPGSQDKKTATNDTSSTRLSWGSTKYASPLLQRQSHPLLWSYESEDKNLWEPLQRSNNNSVCESAMRANNNQQWSGLSVLQRLIVLVRWLLPAGVDKILESSKKSQAMALAPDTVAAHSGVPQKHQNSLYWDSSSAADITKYIFQKRSFYDSLVTHRRNQKLANSNDTGNLSDSDYGDSPAAQGRSDNYSLSEIAEAENAVRRNPETAALNPAVVLSDIVSAAERRSFRDRNTSFNQYATAVAAGKGMQNAPQTSTGSGFNSGRFGASTRATTKPSQTSTLPSSRITSKRPVPPTSKKQEFKH